MKLKYPVLGILLLLVVPVALISGCTQQMNPQGTQQLQTTQEKQTEISLENNGLKIRIVPTEGKKIGGVVIIRLEGLPSKADKLLVSMVPQGFHGSGEELYNNSNVIIEWKDKPFVGQEILIDTEKVQNGVYNIGVSTSYEGAPESSPWSAVVQTQVIVEN